MLEPKVLSCRYDGFSGFFDTDIIIQFYIFTAVIVRQIAVRERGEEKWQNINF